MGTRELTFNYFFIIQWKVFTGAPCIARVYTADSIPKKSSLLRLKTKLKMNTIQKMSKYKTSFFQKTLFY